MKEDGKKKAVRKDEAPSRKQAAHRPSSAPSEKKQSGKSRQPSAGDSRKVELKKTGPENTSASFKAAGRNHTEDILGRSEKRYRTIFETTGTATIIIGPDMTILLANSNFERISGYSRQEIEGKMPWPVFIDHADQEMMKRSHELRRKSPGEAPGSYECRFLSRTGEVRDIFITVALIPGTGESVASLMDITDRKKAEAALVQSEQNYRNIMDSIQEAYYEVDLRGNFTFFNTMAWLALGYSEDELKSMNFHSYVDEKTAKEVYTAFNRVFVTGEPIQAFEFETITAKGERIPVEASISLRRDATGEVLGFKGVVRDVSLRKDAEKALKESEERYRLLAENVDDVIWTMNTEGEFTYVSPSILRKQGFAPRELMGLTPEELVIPDSLAVYEERKKEIFARLAAGERIDRFTLELEVLKKDGSPLWIEVNCSGIYSPLGEFLGLMGVSRDISERKQAEERLRELSLIDELSGLNNRRGFTMLATQQLKIADRFKQKALLVYADLDRMKWINDTLGHKEGDRALMDTAAILRSSFRASDVIARFGGDEFVGLAVESGENTGEVIISRLQEHLNALNIHESRKFKLSISFGIALYDPENPCSLDELLERGDRLMYEQKLAKKKGGVT